jgi:hypothetical protein
MALLDLSEGAKDSVDWLNSQLDTASIDRGKALEKAQMLLNQVQLTSSQLTRDLQTVTTTTASTLKSRLAVQDVKAKTTGLSVRIQRALSELSRSVSDEPSLGLSSKPMHNHDEAFTNLINLDLVLGRMEKTRDALKEAENWNSLSMEMEAIFDSRNYEKAAARLEVCFLASA